ncbi:MAG: alpha/beta fold hydrolase [Actinobacteria bacterium]|nr:alpha/beta fold hydrolase [Actinomycetota bacterium]
MGDGSSVELHVEALGPVDGEPVLLLSGADAQCTRWTPAFVDPLVGAGHRVVRFDTRDCGLSTKLPSDVGYTLDDLEVDACRVLDGEGTEAAHLIGRSMGGMVAQVMALEHPERVRSLTLLCSTPGLGDDRLPPPDDRLVDQMTERLFAPPPVGHVEKVAWLVELDRLFVGNRYPFDETAATLVADTDVARCWFPETGHGPAVNSSPSRLDRLDDIAARTLVVHGTADPVFPVEHGIALAEGIPGAELWLVEGLGHEVPDACLPELLPKVLKHLAA